MFSYCVLRLSSLSRLHRLKKIPPRAKHALNYFSLLAVSVDGKPPLVSIDIPKIAKSGHLAIVAHTVRPQAINCVYRYGDPNHDITFHYVHAILHTNSNKLMAVRLAVEAARVLDINKLRQHLQK